ncbi:hypothetical protein GCM10009624_12100 [Gordonia sinesedis]
MARRKQKRAGGFPSVDPGLGPWNAFPLSVNRNHDVVDPTTGDTGGAPRDDTEVGRRPRAAPDADDADDAVARIRARRRQRDDRT